MKLNNEATVTDVGALPSRATPAGATAAEMVSAAAAQAAFKVQRARASYCFTVMKDDTREAWKLVTGLDVRVMLAVETAWKASAAEEAAEEAAQAAEETDQVAAEERAFELAEKAKQAWAAALELARLARELARLGGLQSEVAK